MTPRTAFVTGGTGFLGRHVVEVLRDQGWRVRAFHRPSSDIGPLRELGVDLWKGSLEREADLLEAIPEAVDAVFHVAGNTSLWRPHNQQQYRDNVENSGRVAEAARKRDAGIFVHTSSVTVYGFQEGVLTEDSPHRGESSWIHYARTKALAEQEVREVTKKGLKAVFINPGHIVGPYDTHNWSRMIRMIQEESLPGVPPGGGSFAHARAVAEAHVAAVDRGRPGENYLLGGVDTSFLEVVQAIGRLLDKPVPAKASPALLLKAVGWFSLGFSYLTGREPDITPEGAALVCDTLRMDSSKSMRELGYEMIPLEDMLRDCLEWMRGEGLLPLDSHPQ